MRKIGILLVALLFLSSGVAFAQLDAPIFPDVPVGHIYREAIEALVGARVIDGNPDGNFSPERAVNRAEMIKMLYRAKGRIPDPANKDCFKDVERESWYETFICDAAANHFVDGYGDSTFRPANLVNRVEAIKMITTVFGISVDDYTEADRSLVKFVDVSTSAWYTKYLSTAFKKGILPIAGQVSGHFNPDWPLLRGEAAAYIFNALNVQFADDRKPSSSASSQASEQSGETSSSAEQTSSEAAASSMAAASYAVDFPFSMNGKFSGKKSSSYTFSLAKNTVMLIETGLQSGQSGMVSCRLYLLGTEGFSDQYFLGFQEGNKCFLKVAIGPGDYQLQLQPTVADVTYTAVATVTTGDGNDGFIQSVKIKRGDTRTEMLSEGDFQDFYSFTVDTPRVMTVTLSNAGQLSCLVYAMKDVDLFGFTGPTCNQSYTYPTGTYTVSVGRKASRTAKQTYTIQVK
ncbi:MAG: S-layer homology domain-containing protein [Candidatus Peribacteraceae bacterium]|nr:S-layer homology domain-containing protein [Candidatus Peribacteraceae bacterium]